MIYYEIYNHLFRLEVHHCTTDTNTDEYEILAQYRIKPLLWNIRGTSGPDDQGLPDRERHFWTTNPKL